MKPIILLDFDRTLFNTDRFWIDFSECLAEVIGISSNQILKAYTDYIASADKTSYIFYEDLIVQYSIDHKSVQETVNKRLSGKQYLFEDAFKLLKNINTTTDRFEISVLTFGQELFQNLKISLCKELKGITSYITLLSKAEFINYYMSNRGGLLVDDRIGQNLPKGWTEVHLDRKTKHRTSRMIKKDLYEIFDLGQLPDVLTTKFDIKLYKNS